MENMIVLLIIAYLILSCRHYKGLQGKAYVAPVVPLLIAAGQAGYQFFQAARQRREAKEAANYVPPALLSAENIAKVTANATRYPGQDEDEAAIRQGTSDTFANIERASSSSGQLINAASGLHNAQARAIQGTARTAQLFKQSALDRYRSVLAQKAGVQMQGRMYSEQLKGAAARNEYNAVNSLGGGVAQAGISNDWNKTYGKNTNPTMMMFNPMASGMGVQMGGPNWIPNMNFFNK